MNLPSNSASGASMVHHAVPGLRPDVASRAEYKNVSVLTYILHCDRDIQLDFENSSASPTFVTVVLPCSYDNQQKHHRFRSLVGRD